MFRALGLIGVSLVILGCAKKSPPTAYGGGPTATDSLDDGLFRITLAKCDREMRCGRVGEGMLYSSRDQCEESARPRIAKELSDAGCRAGFDETALRGCIDALETQDCTASLEQLGTSASCNAGRVCLK